MSLAAAPFSLSVEARDVARKLRWPQPPGAHRTSTHVREYLGGGATYYALGPWIISEGVQR